MQDTTEADDDAVVPKTPTDLSSKSEGSGVGIGDKSERQRTRRLLKSLAKSMQPRSHMTRQDHLNQLYMRRRVSIEMIRSSLEPRAVVVPPPVTLEDDEEAGGASVLEVPKSGASTGEVSLPEDDVVVNQIKSEVGKDEDFKVLSARMQEIMDLMKDYQDLPPVESAPLEVRVNNLTYTVMVETEPVIETVFNTSPIYPIYKWYKEKFRGEKRKPRERAPKKVLDQISLVLKPGKMYLVLGPPGAGKSSLLQSITGLLKPGKDESLEGSVCYNGRQLKVSKRTFLPNNYNSCPNSFLGIPSGCGRVQH